MGSRVELFEQIRREHEFGGLSKHALARKYGVHRRTVRQALLSPLPPQRKRPVGRPAPALGAYRELIDAWLVADRSAPVKQRHTAKRVWETSCVNPMRERSSSRRRGRLEEGLGVRGKGGRSPLWDRGHIPRKTAETVNDRQRVSGVR